jgi:hypothetical protein
MIPPSSWKLWQAAGALSFILWIVPLIIFLLSGAKEGRDGEV